MDIRKDDPVYYKLKLNKLIQQAEDEGLMVLAKDINLGEGISIQFKSPVTGEKAVVNLLKS